MAAMSLFRAPLLTGICVDNTPTNAVKKIFITCRNSTPHRFPWEIHRMKNPAQQQPMPTARKEGLLVRELDDEVLVYDLHSHKAHCLNTTAALIWKHCDGQRSVSDIALILETHQDTPVHPDIVQLGLHQLGRTHLLEKQITGTPGNARLSRRDVIKRLGAAVAVALPAVTSILSPIPIEAATCLPPSAVCTTPGECCSKACNGGPPGVCG